MVVLTERELEDIRNYQTEFVLKVINSKIDELKNPKLVKLLQNKSLNETEIGYLSAIKDLQCFIAERFED